MQVSNLKMPGYQVNEYLLVLSPHQALWDRIMSIKKDFAQKFDAPFAEYSKPHITLINFVNWAMMEEKILQRMEAIANGVAPIKVELRDFGSFPSHTIHINVVSKMPIKSVVDELKTGQRLFKLNNEHKPHFIEEPHMTICRQLKPWQYEKAWLEYSNSQFTGRFIADSMQLLRRPVSDTKQRFINLRSFKFLNQQVKSEQASLFM